jgi:hypothetical protein
MKDPIVEEVRRIREQIFAEYDYDLDRYYEAIRKNPYPWPGKTVSVDEAAGRTRTSNPGVEK